MKYHQRYSSEKRTACFRQGIKSTHNKSNDKSVQTIGVRSDGRTPPGICHAISGHLDCLASEPLRHAICGTTSYIFDL